MPIPVRTRPAGRVAPQRVKPRQVLIFRGTVNDLGGGELTHIKRRDRSGHLINLNGAHLHIRAGESQCIRTNPAPQINDRGDPSLSHTSRMMGGNGKPRGLRQPVAGKQHV